MFILACQQLFLYTKLRGTDESVPEGASQWRPDELRSGSGDEEALSDGPRASDGLVGHQPRPQLARLTHLSTGLLGDDTVAAASAAPLPGLGVRVGLRVIEGVSDFARHQAQRRSESRRCSIHYVSPVFSREEVCYLPILT